MRKRWWLVVLSVVVASLALAACTDDSGGGASPAERKVGPGRRGAQDGPVVTEPGPVQLTVGGRATIRLRANATTGYQWQPTAPPDPAVATIVSGGYRPDPTTGDRVGGGGTQDVVVQGVAPGTTTLELGYVRPWEQGTAPAKTATYTITVS